MKGRRFRRWRWPWNESAAARLDVVERSTEGGYVVSLGNDLEVTKLAFTAARGAQLRTLRQAAKGGDVAMGGKYEGCRESQRMLEPAESEGNEAARAALVCKLYNG